MTGPLVAELVAYEPGTETVAGHLPEPLSWDASMVHNDVGSLRLTYTRKAVGGGLLARGLAEGLDIGLRLSIDGDEWFEPDGGRFPLVRRDVNPADTQETVTLTLPSYGWMLSRMRVLALDLLQSGGDFDGQRLFEAVTAGKIMHPLLGEYMARHADPLDIDWSFTASADSASVAWPSTDWAIPYAVGTDYRTILAGLASMGLCDWRTRGRELMAWVANTQFANRSADVKLHLGLDVSDAPSTETLEDVASYTLVRGEGTVVATVIDGTAPTPWGAWEGYLQAAGATTEAEAQEMVARDVEARARVTGQYTQTLILDGAQVLPWRDYVPGDMVSAHGSSGMAAMRVQQVTLSYSGGKLGGSVVLNDRLVPVDLRMARRLSLLTGGTPGGVGTLPTLPPVVVPAAPTGLDLTTNAWWNYGVSRATVSATWAAVTESTESRPVVVASYRVRVIPVGLEATAASTSAVIEDLPTGMSVQVQVAAVSDLGVQGQWSSVAGISTAVPPDTLVPPTALTLSTGDGVVRAVWNGKLQAPPAAVVDPPVHFSRVIVQSATAAGGPWTTQGSIDTAGGRWVIPGDPGQTVYVRGIAVDRAGNQTGPGPVSSIAVVSWVHTAVTEAQADADAAMAAASNAQTTADGRNRIRTGQTQPETPAGGWVQGDQWYVQNASAQTTSIRIWNGSSFVAYQQVADSILVPGSVGNVLIENGAITAPKLTVSQAMIDTLAVDSFWASKIKAPWLQVDAAMIDALTVNTSLWAEKVKAPFLDVDQAMIDALTVNASLWAQKIQTPMLLVGSFDNLLDNPRFDTLAGWWTWPGGWTTQDVGGDWANCARAAITSSGWMTCAGPKITCQAGDKFRIDAGIYDPAVGTGEARVAVYFRDAAGTDLAAPGFTQTANDSWSKVGGEVTAPSGAVTAQYYLIVQGRTSGPAVYFGVPTMRRMMTGSLIVDGAIDGKVISAPVINGGTINGGSINGGTFTGGMVRTAESGARLEQSGNEIRLYAANNRLSGAVRPSQTFSWLPPEDQWGTEFVCFLPGYSRTSYAGEEIRWEKTNDIKYSRVHVGRYGIVLDTFGEGILLGADWDYGLKITDPKTTSNSANCVLYGSGDYREVRRASSVRASKRLIADAPPTDFLAMRPRVWFDKSEMLDAGLDPDTATEQECHGAGLRRIPGFVAEEVEQVNRLFCVYDQSEDGPALSTVAYDRLAVAIHATLTDITARLEALETTR